MSATQSISFEIKNKNDMNIVYSKLNDGDTYDNFCLWVENVYLTKKFYDKLSLLIIKDFSIHHSFLGDCLSKCKKLPKDIESLSITSPLNLTKCVIRSICRLINLTDINLGGYIGISMKDIDKILFNCKNINTMYLSYPIIDIDKPSQSYTNIINFSSVGFDKNAMNPKMINIYAWFPMLKCLNLYCGDKFNVSNIHMLKDLKDLNLIFNEYDEKSSSEIDLIYPQLTDANIIVDRIGVTINAASRIGSIRWPLKNFSSKYL